MTSSHSRFLSAPPACEKDVTQLVLEMSLAGELELDGPEAKSLWSTREAILALRGEEGLSARHLSHAPTREPLELPSAKPD